MIETYSFVYDGNRTNYFRSEPEPDAAPIADCFILHGGGTASKERFVPLLEALSAVGFRSFCLDFHGHGSSTVALGTQTLSARKRQAERLIVAESRGPLVLLGFSMGGHTVASLVSERRIPVVTIGLFAPAAYAAEAEDLTFQSDFTKVIRQPNSWKSSRAFEAIRQFEGRKLLVLPATDDVIPIEITEAYGAAVRATETESAIVRLPNANHRLGLWLHDHPEDCAIVADRLIDITSSDR
jgi:uncharacterized protein